MVTPDQNNIHAYMFVFDTSNKRTWDSMMCILSTIYELEKTKKKGAGIGAGGKKAQAQPYFPKKIVVGNKKDLKVNRDAGGIIGRDDISKLLNMFPTIKVREVSALTNTNVSEVFN